jgi:CAAX protease family protein
MTPLREGLLVFGVATALNALCFQIGRVVPLVGNNLPALVAVTFLYLPVWIAWREGNDLSRFGVRFRPLRRQLAFALLVPAVVFPLFLVGFVLFHQALCGHAVGPTGATGPCAGFRGWSGLAHLRGPDGLAAAIFTQVVVVAIPEELFFRGYLLARLEQAFPPRLRVLGGGLGAALALQALLFALGHVLVDGNLARLAVFFPGLLFGWTRSATGSILPGVAIHAAANLYIETLQRTLFG